MIATHSNLAFLSKCAQQKRIAFFSHSSLRLPVVVAKQKRTCARAARILAELVCASFGWFGGVFFIIIMSDK